jgi:hypothetical protein
VTLGKTLEWMSVACWGGAGFLGLARMSIADPSIAPTIGPILSIAILLGAVTGIARLVVGSGSPRVPDRVLSPAERAREIIDGIEASSPTLRSLPTPPSPRPRPRRPPRPTDRPGGDTHDLATKMPVPRYDRTDADGWLPRRATRQRERGFERSASA